MITNFSYMFTSKIFSILGKGYGDSEMADLVSSLLFPDYTSLLPILQFGVQKVFIFGVLKLQWFKNEILFDR